MMIPLTPLLTSLTDASLPVVGVAYCTPEARAAHIAAHAPVQWFSLPDAEVRLDLSRALTDEEQAQAEGIITAFGENIPTQ